MKKIIYLAVALLAFNLPPVFGQSLTPEQQVIQLEANRLTNTPPYGGRPPRQLTSPSLPPAGTQDFQQRLHNIINNADPNGGQASALTKFSLDFPGGPPVLLVKAIEKALGKPLNVIIPTEAAQEDLPPLKMNDVVVPQLFAALEVASRKTVAYSTGFGGGYSQMTTEYGFKTADGPLTDASIWTFHAEKPSMPPLISTEKICAYYSLAPYLDRGFTVDDITTAIQTGWKMAGDSVTPELNYHKETKMLIAYGEPKKLDDISKVLNALPSVNAETWRKMSDQIRDLKQQVEQLKNKVSAPATPNATTLEIK